jgi:hypothetical protein
VQIPVSAKNANGKPALLLQSAGIVIASEKNDTASTAKLGTRCRLSRRKSHQPGMPRSRENAYQVRAALVSPAATQKIWPTVQIRSTAFAAAEVRAVVMIGIEPPPPSLIASTSLAAKTRARSTNQPMIADQKTERQTPCAAATAAPRVSSAVCADASYPVCVYIVSRKPIGITRIQKGRLATEPPSKPVLLILWPKTNPAS